MITDRDIGTLHFKDLLRLSEGLRQFFGIFFHHRRLGACKGAEHAFLVCDDLQTSRVTCCRPLRKKGPEGLFRLDQRRSTEKRGFPDKGFILFFRETIQE